MLIVVLGVALTAALVLAFVSSAFIFFIILTSKQYKNSTSLLHLQLMVTGVLLSLLFIIFSTPSFIQGRWLLHDDHILREEDPAPPTDSPWEGVDPNNSTVNLTLESPDLVYLSLASWEPANLTVASNASSPPPSSEDLWESDALCRVYGFLLVTLHAVAVWVVVGLHCDKYCAIATPLRYNQIVTRHRVGAFSCLAWLLSLALASPPLTGEYAYAFSQGVCLPAWHRSDATLYTWTVATLCILLPFAILLIVNTRIIMIARHHQHRIFSAIFEVMMSAQATVTHQKNPFDIPKKKRKSVWTVLEQIVAFVVCYYPFFGTVVWESLRGRRANQYWGLIGLTFLLVSPLVNSFIYGVKCKNIRKAFRNYLRKKLYKTEVKHEIQARIPSAANSRRPSISSTLAMPILHKSLQRRMSDYLLQDQSSPPKLIRRSSDMSWHPLEDGTPSPTRLRRPIGASVKAPEDASPVGSHSPASVSNFLTVPTFEAARSYYIGQQRVRLSISSLDSDASVSVRETRTEEENWTGSPSPEIPSRYLPKFQDSSSSMPLGTPEHSANRSKSLELPIVSCHETPSRLAYQGDGRGQADCQTPLLCKAFDRPARSASLNSSSPHVLRTLEAILSVRISQSLLRHGSGWGGSQGSLERLSRFLRESRRCTLPQQYSPFALGDSSSQENFPGDANDCLATPETPGSKDVSVLTFITPLANGSACMGVCGKEGPHETSLMVP